VAWFASCWWNMPEVVEKVAELGADQEVLTQSMIKEATNLTKGDLFHIGGWLLQQSKVDKKSINSLLKRMRIRRYCIWCLMHPQNQAVQDFKSM